MRSVPDMVYLTSELRFENATCGLGYVFCAEDALRRCSGESPGTCEAVAVDSEAGASGTAVLQAAAAQRWKELCVCVYYSDSLI